METACHNGKNKIHKILFQRLCHAIYCNCLVKAIYPETFLVNLVLCLRLQPVKHLIKKKDKKLNSGRYTG